jgi:hypothetical protein
VWSFTSSPLYTLHVQGWLYLYLCISFFLSFFLEQELRSPNSLWQTLRLLFHEHYWRVSSNHWFIWSCFHTATRKKELHKSQSQEAVRYGRESRGTRNQEWLCRWGPAAIYPTDRRHTTDQCFAKTHRLQAILAHLSALSRVGVTIDGVWIGEYIYWPLIHTTQNYK